MRVYKKNSQSILGKPKYFPIPNEIDYKNICENIKCYLVFRISVATSLNERMAYLDIFKYMEQIRLEANKIKEVMK